MSEKWRNPSTLPILHKTTRISPSSGTISGFLLSCSKEKTERQDNCMDFAKALNFVLQVILSERTTFSTLRFSWKIKYFTEQNNFYRSDILHDFLISSF